MAKESHIDVTLGSDVLVEKDIGSAVVDLYKKGTVSFSKKQMPHFLKPKEFALFVLKEWIEVPNDMTADFYIDSRVARSCLDHTAATLLLPGWKGYLTLELSNLSKHHILGLKEGMPIGKVVFHKHDLCAAYEGSFNNQREVRA